MSLYSLTAGATGATGIKWAVIAEGATLDTLKAAVPDQEFGKGVPIRFEMDLKLPLARAFDLAGAEHLFSSQMPEGMDLLDVHSEGNSRVIIEAECDPVWLAAIIPIVTSKWFIMSLVAIGVMMTMGALVTAVKVEAPEEFVQTGLETVKWLVVGGLGLGTILLVREFVRR